MGKTALIIDDDRAILKNFSRLLQEDGYQVFSAATGNEAMDQVNQRSFDLLLIDFRLPDFDGIQLLEMMGDKVKDAVKLMITGYPMLDTCIKALDLGVDSFIEKPIKPEDLMALIEEKTSKKQQEKNRKTK